MLEPWLAKVKELGPAIVHPKLDPDDCKFGIPCKIVLYVHPFFCGYTVLHRPRGRKITMNSPRYDSSTPFQQVPMRANAMDSSFALHLTLTV